MCLNKTEDLTRINEFKKKNMTARINELKTLAKHISCQCKCKWECRRCHACEKYYIWNSATCICENGKYLASIMDNLVQ